jgi:hypothetical protein
MNELIALSIAKRADSLSASNKVRATLTSTLLIWSHTLSQLEPTDDNIRHLARLTDVAKKLFAWAPAKPIDSTADRNNSNSLHTPNAINLPLIRTTPKQLRDKAKAKAEKRKNLTFATSAEATMENK